MKRERYMHNNDIADLPANPVRFSRTGLEFDNGEEDNGWLISMSDLMSLLLVFFLVWTAVNMSEMQKQKSRITGDNKMASTTAQDCKLPAVTAGAEQLYEIIPAGTGKSVVVVSFREEDEPQHSDFQNLRRATARLVPVDMQVISLR
jgi:hypothetical protein